MSISIWLWILFREIVIIKGAPKLGHVLFDPLSYEAAKFEEVKASILNNEASISTNHDKITTSKTTLITPNLEANDTISITHKTPTMDSLKPLDENTKENGTNKLTDMFEIIEDALRDIKRTPNELLNLLRTGDGSQAPETKEPCAEYEYNGKICKYINKRLLCGYNKNKGELKDVEFIDVGNGCRMHNDRIECGYQKGPFSNPRRPPAWDETHYEDLTNNTDKNKQKNNKQLRKLISKKTASDSEIEPTSISKNIPNPQVSFTPDIVSVVTVTDAVPVSTAATVVTTDSTPVTPTANTTTTTTNSITEITTKVSAVSSTESKNTTIESSWSTASPSISEKETSPSAKIVRSILRSNADSSEISKSTASKVKNKRWCVEVGDRIVCHYTKNN